MATRAGDANRVPGFCFIKASIAMDAFPPRNKVKTTSLKSGIAYGIAVLGAIPLRYNEPRFPALKRRWQNDTQETRLLSLGENAESFPSIFALAQFSGFDEPQRILGNRAALRGGINLGSSNGQLVSISGAAVQVSLSANIYATSMDPLLEWVRSVFEFPEVKGMSEFAEGASIPISVTIDKSFQFTDPIEKDDSGTFLERMFSIEVQFKVTTVAARVETVPLYRATIINTTVDKTTPAETSVVIPATDPTDWS